MFKRKADGFFNGRVVAQGWNQVPGLDSGSTYAPVMNASTGNWFNTIDPVLVEIGFVALKSDPCVYFYDHNRVKIILTLYVDGLLLSSILAILVIFSDHPTSGFLYSLRFISVCWPHKR